MLKGNSNNYDVKILKITNEEQKTHYERRISKSECWEVRIKDVREIE